MASLRLIAENLKWLVISLAFSSLSIFFSYWIFPSQASMLSITFLVIALTPLLYRMMEAEEDVVAKGGKNFVQRYGSIFWALTAISAGMVLSFYVWHQALPSDPGYSGSSCSTQLPCKEAVFSMQESGIEERGYSKIGILIGISFLLSLFLGAGAILIIAWDMSSLVVMGPDHMLAYLPQLVSYFLAGMAGVLLSFAVIRHEWRSHGFFKVMRDSLILLVISLLLVPASSFLFSLL
jgi:hypothetical protein